MTELLSLSILPLMLTLLAYQAGAALQKRFHSALFNPILIGVFLVLLFLVCQRIPYIFAPFHGANAVSVQVILPADVPKVVGRAQAVHIEMEKGQPAAQIFVYDGVGGTSVIDATVSPAPERTTASS